MGCKTYHSNLDISIAEDLPWSICISDKNCVDNSLNNIKDQSFVYRFILYNIVTYEIAFVGEVRT